MKKEEIIVPWKLPGVRLDWMSLGLARVTNQTVSNQHLVSVLNVGLSLGIRMWIFYIRISASFKINWMVD